MYYRMLIILLLTNISYCQDLISFKHPTENFEIGIPIGWTKIIPKNELKLEAYSPNQIPRENFNVNIFNTKMTDLKTAYEGYLYTFSKDEGFEVIERGTKKINGREYVWHVEKNINVIDGREMQHLVYLTNNNGNILILTLVSTPTNFSSHRKLFDQVAESLKY